jgi:hypothetical protein
VAKKTGVPPAVIAAVKAWAGEPDMEKAAAVLAAARRTLDPALLPALIEEVAEITAELLVVVLDMPPSSPPGRDEKPVEIEGLELYPAQIERLNVWIEDQAPTARALGMDVETWFPHVERGFVAWRARERGEGSPARAPAGTEAAERLFNARRLLGDEQGAFENRAPAGQSETAGLRGVLAARAFAKGEKPKR